MSPKVSVLIPCYNAEHFLPECLNSVVNQTLEDMEIICINDGSQDDTLGILQAYAAKDSRIKIIDKLNSGYGDSMNIALDAARGTYIGIVEADDIVDVLMYETLLDLAEKNNVDIVKSGFYKFWKTPNNRKEYCGVPSKYEERLIAPYEIDNISNFRITIWTNLYKKSFLDTNKIRFTITSGASYQDTAFNFKTLIMAKLIYVTKSSFYMYRQDNECSSVKRVDKVYEIINEIREIDNYICKYNNKDWVVRLRDTMLYECYKWNYNRLSFSGRRKFINEMIKEFRVIKERTFFDRKDLCRMYQVIRFPNLYIVKTFIRDFIKRIIKGVVK